MWTVQEHECHKRIVWVKADLHVPKFAAKLGVRLDGRRV